ncbi:MAG: hypothetical protein ABSA91_04900 [Acidimicrobiales bacterium]
MASPFLPRRAAAVPLLPRSLISGTRPRRQHPNDGNGPSQAQLAQMMSRALKYSQCMRSHGVPDFPDPTESPNGIGIRLSGIDPNSAQFRASQTACRAFSPAD